MTAIIGPFDFCAGKSMQLEQMTTIIGRVSFIRKQSKPGLIIIGPIESYSCAARLALSPAQTTDTVILIKEEPTHEG